MSALVNYRDTTRTSLSSLYFMKDLMWNNRSISKMKINWICLCGGNEDKNEVYKEWFLLCTFTYFNTLYVYFIFWNINININILTNITPWYSEKYFIVVYWLRWQQGQEGPGKYEDGGMEVGWRWETSTARGCIKVSVRPQSQLTAGCRQCQPSSSCYLRDLRISDLLSTFFSHPSPSDHTVNTLVSSRCQITKKSSSLTLNSKHI